MPQQTPQFLVDPYSDPVAVKIVGKATFQVVHPLKEFLAERYEKGKSCFVFDFSECAGMDSTVLGVLAGCALELRKREPRGSLVLSRLGARNMELVKNLGLHRIATVDMGEDAPNGATFTDALPEMKTDELGNARLCLEAHENLIEASDRNRAKFQDVITYLQNRIQEED